MMPARRSVAVTRPALSVVPLRRREPLDPLRRRLDRTGAGSVEAVLADFIEDDLACARAAADELVAWIDRVEAALTGPEPALDAPFALVGADDAVAQADALAATVFALRRRVGRLATRLAEGPDKPYRR